MEVWARRLLGEESPAPPDMGAPPSGPAPGDTAFEGDDADMDLDEDELEKVARIDERECADLERRMRGLNSGQQRALRLERGHGWTTRRTSGDPPRSETAVLGKVPQTPK